MSSSSAMFIHYPHCCIDLRRRYTLLPHMFLCVALQAPGTCSYHMTSAYFCKFPETLLLTIPPYNYYSIESPTIVIVGLLFCFTIFSLLQNRNPLLNQYSHSSTPTTFSPFPQHHVSRLFKTHSCPFSDVFGTTILHD